MENKLAEEQAQALLELGVIASKETQETINEKSEQIITFLKENSDVSKLSDEEKDEKHQQIKDLWDEYSTYLRDIEYNFKLTGHEFHYLRNLILKKNGYDENTLFVALKVKEEFFDSIDIKSVKKTADTIDNLTIQINILTLVHHVIKDNIVRDLEDPKTLMFATILTSLGNISKVFNKWNSDSEELSKNIYTWTIGLEEEEKEKIKEQLQTATEVTSEEVEEVTVD